MTNESSPLRIGLIGAGAIVQLSHLPVLSELSEVEVRAIADPGTERTEALAREYGIAPYSDHRDMISGEDLDAVLIAIPNHLHLAVIEDAASAGLHVFCEKPLAHRLEDALEIDRLMRERGLVGQIGFNQRFRTPVGLAKQAIESGVLGEVQAFRSVYSESWEVYPSVTRYRYDLAQSGGAAILDLGSHRIDLARYLMGEIVEVCATVDHREIPFPADDNVFILVRFASGATGVISSDRFSPQVSNATDLYGPLGTVHLSTETISPFASAPFALSSKVPENELPAVFREAHWPTAWWNAYEPGEWLTLNPPRTNPYRLEWEAFVRAVRGEADVDYPSFADGARTQEVVAAAYRSARTRQWVSLPLVDPVEPIPAYEMEQAS